MATITPAIRTYVSQTNLVTNPSFEAAGTVTTLRTNLATNPSFAAGTAGWTSDTATFVASTAKARTGTQSCLVTPAPGGGGRIWTSSTVAAGTTYAISAYIYSETGGDFRIWYLGQAGSLTTTVPAKQWTRISQVAAATITASVYIASVTADPFYVDDVLIENAPTVGSYFSGATPAAGDFSYAWTGTANASTSIQTALAAAGSVAIGWRPPGILSTDWKSTGTKSIRCLSGRGPGQTDAFVAPGGDGGTFRNGMQAGKTYTVTVKCRLKAPQANPTDFSRQLQVRGGNASDSYRVLASVTAPNVAGVHQLSVFVTIPADAVAAFVRLYHGAYDTEDIWWDDFSIVEGYSTGDYFDGSNKGADGADTTWNGLANASTSTRKVADPLDLVLPMLVRNYETARPARSIVHQSLDSWGTSYVTFRDAGPRVGTLQLLLPSLAAAQDTVTKLTRPSHFLLAAPETPQWAMSFVVTAGDLTIRQDQDTLVRYLVDVPYQEITG